MKSLGRLPTSFEGWSRLVISGATAARRYMTDGGPVCVTICNIAMMEARAKWASSEEVVISVPVD